MTKKEVDDFLKSFPVNRDEGFDYKKVLRIFDVVIVIKLSSHSQSVLQHKWSNSDSDSVCLQYVAMVIKTQEESYRAAERRYANFKKSKGKFTRHRDYVKIVNDRPNWQVLVGGLRKMTKLFLEKIQMKMMMMMKRASHPQHFYYTYLLKYGCDAIKGITNMLSF